LTRRRAPEQRRLSTVSGTLKWSELLFNLTIGEILVLEQLYVVEQGPVTLSQMQRRLSHLNVHPRTVTRYCRRLEEEGLLATISSFDLFINPVVPLQGDVHRLVKLWHIREARGRLRTPRQRARESATDLDDPSGFPKPQSNRTAPPNCQGSQ